MENNKSKGELGDHRRKSGVFVIIITSIVMALSGLEGYTVDSSIIWSGYITGMGLLITGLAKDVVAIAKAKMT